MRQIIFQVKIRILESKKFNLIKCKAGNSFNYTKKVILDFYNRREFNLDLYERNYQGLK